MSSPLLLTSELDNVGIVSLNMAHKRNALNEEAIAAIDSYFSTVPSHIRVILLKAECEHFCAGLDLKEHRAYFALPEGTRGIFTGGGATVRTARIVSAPRMVEMMLTGRVIDAQEGRQLGLAHYVRDTENGDTPALEFAIALAKKIAGNAELSNYAIVSAINRIADMSATDGLFAEGLVMAMIQQGHDVQARLGEFVNKKASKVQLPPNPGKR